MFVTIMILEILGIQFYLFVTLDSVIQTHSDSVIQTSNMSYMLRLKSVYDVFGFTNVVS